MGRSFKGKPILIYINNQAAIQMSLDSVYMSKTKHINIAVHHICDEVAKERIHLLKIDGKFDPADLLTKPLSSVLHFRCIHLLGME